MDINATLQSARRALGRREYERAVELTSSILSSNPRVAEAYFLFLMIRLHSGSSDPRVLKGIEELTRFRRAMTADQAWAARGLLGVNSSAGTTVEGLVVLEGLNEFRQPFLQGYSEIGLFSYVGPHALFGANTRMGRYCSIAMNSSVGPGEHTPGWLTTHNFARGKPNVDREAEAAVSNEKLEIGHDVWIGANAFVSTNIKVGHGAVIGAGATVVKDVPPYAIVVGNPARLLRLRFPEKSIERLLASEWWRLPVDHVRELPFHDVERCLDQVEQLRAKLPDSALI